MSLIFDPSWSSKVKFDDTNRKPVCPTRKCSLGVQPRICHRFRVISSQNFDCSPFYLGGLPLGPRSRKGETTYYPPRSTILQNFSPIAQTVYEICVTKVFHFLAPGGLTPGAKFTKRGDDLADTELYHPPKFHRPTSTHAGDIRYQKSCGHIHTHTQTGNDISTTCLSACVDK